MAKSDNGELNQSDLQSDNSDPNNKLRRGTKRLRNMFSMVIWNSYDEKYDYGNVQRTSSLSIFKKVTKRVSASLAKWFGPSGEGQSVIRRRESVEEDDEALQIHQPPKKRARPNVELDGFAMTSTPLGGVGGLSGSNSLLSRDLHLETPGPSGFKRYLPVPSATVVNGDDKSDSGDSTSGYSSVLAQQHKEPSFVSDRGALIQPGTSAKSSPCPSKTLNTSLNSTRSLFSSESLNPKRQCLSSRRPSFNASTFGSPSFVDRTLSTKRAVNSPFYSGRTTFGGASAYRRNRFLTNNLPVKSSVSMKPVNDGASTSTAENASLSKTARRILETLEHFNTPVLDARKIPNINRQNCDLSKTRKTPYARDLNNPKPGPSNRELLIPSVPDLLKMKQKKRLQDSTVQVRNMAVNSKSVLNTEYSLPSLITVPNNEESAQKQHTNKMKSKITSSVREKKTQIDVDYILEPVPLPDIKLPITSLPKFDFAVAPPPSVTTLPTLPVSKSPIIKDLPQRSPKSPKTPQKVLEYLKGLEYNFNFSKPLVLTSDIPKSISSINNFKFSDPIDAKANIAAVSTLITFKESTGGSTAPRKKNNGQQSITSSPVVSILQPASKLVEGSVMDILGKDDKNDDKKPWECSNCLVRNMYCDSKCHACQTLRENIKKVEKKPISGLTGFGNKFKMEADKRECSACMVRNSNNDDKCAACTTPKPGATNNKSVKSSVNPPAIASSSKSSFGNWGDKFKTPSDMWECTACMIRNKAGVVKCIACETPKPGSNSKPAPVTGTGNKALIIPSTKSGGFGDLIKKQQSDWECSSCMVRNPPEKKACACCEAPKPGEAQQVVLAKPPAPCQFKFGLDKVSSNALASTSTNASNGGFKFGAAVDVVDNSTPVTFSFGVSPASSKPVSSPGFSFGIPAATTTTVLQKIEATATSSSSATFSFGTPTVVSKPATNSLNFGVVTSTSTTVIKPLGSNIFGTPDKKVDSTPSVAVSSTTTISAPTLSAAKNAAPQFNFAPFMPKTETVKASPQIEAKPSEPTAPRPAEGLPSFGAFKSTMFNVPGHALAPPSTRTLAFGANTDTAKPSSSAFAFAKPAGLHHAVSVSKEPVFNFASGTGEPVTSNLFSFGSKPATEAPKKDVAPTFAISTPSTFGSQQQAAPQNGGFNFGAPASKPSFNFGASPAVNTPSTASMFGFGASQSQAGTGSLPAATGGVAPAPTPAAPASGVFTFGGPAPAFTGELKPNNLFNTGAFTAPSSSTSSAGPTQRRIRKAIRRTQPRMSGQWPPTD